tara:strand:+ start:325 stop:498 length:174 start_codon:yes stop_codon:yes gene_type:complete
MIIDRSDFNDSKLWVTEEFDEEGEIEIDIIGGKLDDRSIWLNKEQVKELINVLLNAL